MFNAPQSQLDAAYNHVSLGKWFYGCIALSQLLSVSSRHRLTSVGCNMIGYVELDFDNRGHLYNGESNVDRI